MTDDKRVPADDPATLSGAYVLNALTAEQREAFEAHLAESEALRQETTELADTAVLLGGAVEPVQPPAALKANIMGLIASTPQLPAASPSLASVPAIPEPVEATPVPASTPATQKAQARWFTRPVTAIAAAVAAVGIILGGGVLVNRIGDAQQLSQAADQLAAINASADMQQAAAEVTGGGAATLIWSNELGSSAIIFDGLAPLPDDKVYELWYIDTGSVARPAGTFHIDSSGATWQVLDGDMRAGDTVGLTVEPNGGSETPTTEPIVAIASA